MTLHEKLQLAEDASIFSNRHRNRKISDNIIQHIRELFASGQLNPGDKLGSEKELMDAFGVSKATLREALRVLEAMGIVEIRKGLTGGVFAAQVDMKTTISSILGFLRFESVSISDITMLRYLIEPHVVRIAISCLSDGHIKKLQEIVQEPQTVDPSNRQFKGVGFHRYLARMTGNSLIILMMDFIDNLLEDMKDKAGLGPDFYRSVYQYHSRILNRIMEKDTVGAQEILVQDILATGNIISAALGSVPFDPDTWMVSNGKAQASKVPLFVSRDEPISVDGNKMFFKKVGTGELFMVVLKDGS